jgi:hypothetical protein
MSEIRSEYRKAVRILMLGLMIGMYLRLAKKMAFKGLMGVWKKARVAAAVMIRNDDFVFYVHIMRHILTI